MTNKSEEVQVGAFRVLFILSLSIIIFNNWIQAEENSSPSLSRYRVFSLKHIPAKQGKAVLENLEIGTVSQLPNSNTLLVTSGAEDLKKASVILELIDSQQKYVMEIISSASEAKHLPTNEQLEKELGPDISIGTFDNPPSNLAKEKILIDTYKDMVLAFGREEFLGNIFNAIDRFSYPQETSEAMTEPNLSLTPGVAEQPNGNDEFFRKLLESLDEAEQKATELQLTSKPSDEVKSKIIDLQKEKTDKPMPDVSAVAEKGPEGKTTAEQMDADTQGLEELLSTLSQESSADETSIPLADVTLKPGEDRAQPKSGAISLREEKPTETLEKIEVDESLYRPEFSVGTKEELKINLPSKLNITDLLSLVGEYLELDFMYDPRKVTGEVMLKFRGPIRVKDLYPLMESVLKFHGFVMTRKESLVTIVPVAEALNYDPEIYSEPGSVKVGDVIITRIFKLQHIDTTSAKNFLERMKLGASIEEIPATKTLIVTEFAYRMARIEELIKMVDQPGKPKKFRYRRLEYTLAPSLVTEVKSLADKLGTVSVTIAAGAKAPAPTTQPAGRRTPARPAPKPPSRPATPQAEAIDTSVYLVADERTNRILMIGLEEDLNVIEDIIGALDVEKQDLRMLRLYEIQNVGAEDVAGKLRDLGIISTLPSSATRRATSRGRITAAPQPAPQRPGGAQPQPQTTTAASVEEILTGEPQVVIIESTNSLLINGTAEQHAQIALIIGYVDSETERTSIPYVVYPLENQDPTELAQTLNQLIKETTETQDKEGKIIGSTTTKLIEEDIVIIPDSKTYSLIVYASKKNQQWISSIIKQLDEYRPQVLLDVTLVEVTKNDKFDYELNLIQAFPDLTEISGQITPFTDLSGIKRERFIEYQSNNGSGIGFYADEHINALLQAVQTKNYGRILARPKILVNDNQDGTIKAQNQNFVAQTQTNVVPTGSGTATTQTSVNFQSYTAGIELTIKPHISKGQQLQLDITLDRTDFSGEARKVKVGDDELEVPRDTVTSNVKTMITVPDGKTIILGGLEKLKQSKGGNKVPLLGDLPVVGGLFRGIHNSDEQDRLYVFVKAHILRPGEQIEEESDIIKISNKNRATFEKYEREMQEYQGWPGIKSKPIDPVSVLEKD
jgi:general secretion pathway protein D